VGRDVDMVWGGLDETGYDPCVVNLLSRDAPGKHLGIAPPVLEQDDQAFVDYGAMPRDILSR